MTDSVRATPINPNPDTAPLDGSPDAGQSMAQADSPATPNDVLDKEELLKRVIEWFQASRDHFQEWRMEATSCYDFTAGHQWEEDDLQILRDQGRPAVTFNRIGPFVDGVSGLEVGNRQTTMYYPRKLGDAAKDELLTDACQWARDLCDAEDEESESVRDVIICGVGVTQTRMSYDDDPDGLIKIDRVDPLELYPDPSSRKPNYDESRFVIRVKDIPVPAAEEMFPGYPTQDLHAQWAEDRPDETQSPHNARLAPYYRIDQAGNIDRERMQCRIAEVEWWDYLDAYRVMDPTSGRFVRLDVQSANTYRMRARLLGQKPVMMRDRERRYYKAIVGNAVLKVMRGPDKGGFSYKFMTGKRDRNKGTWYGLVRAMVDPQMWANKFFTQALHIVNVNAKGGLLAETDAFVDVDEARDAWAEADSIVELNPGGLAKVQQKQPPAFPMQINQMMETALDAIPATAGVNLEMIAQQTKDQPGVLEMQRKQQGMTVLAYIFDAKRRYQKEQGRLMIWMLQTFISDGRLIRIGGPDEAQYVPFIRDPSLEEYDVVVDDAPSSPNMKERVWAMIMQMFPMMSRMALPPQVMLEMMQYSPLPATLISKVKEMMQSQPPPGQAAQQSKQAVDQARAALDQARAGHVSAQADKTKAETAMVPVNAQLEAQKQQADIEKARADAANSLQDAGVVGDGQRFQQLIDAVDSLLKVQGQGHDQALAAQDQQHQQGLDLAQHALAVHQATNPPPQPPVQPPQEAQA